MNHIEEQAKEITIMNYASYLYRFEPRDTEGAAIAARNKFEAGNLQGEYEFNLKLVQKALAPIKEQLSIALGKIK
jgi:hypothetical protein